MDTPIIAQYYREADPLKRKVLLDEALASGEDREANEIRQEIWQIRYGRQAEQGGPADAYLRLWMTLEFNRNVGHKFFGARGAQKDIRKELALLKFQELRTRSALHEELLYRECQHLVALYMDLCAKDKNYNSVILGLMTMKEESSLAKMKRDIYETAVCVPRDVNMEDELSLLTRAARKVYEDRFPGEGGMAE